MQALGLTLTKTNFILLWRREKLSLTHCLSFPQMRPLKNLLFKHIVFWNKECKIYEKFTLTTYESQEDGDECIQMMWSGEYNGEPKECEYSEFFANLKNSDLVPILIIWEKSQTREIAIRQDKYTGIQSVEIGDKLTNSRKYEVIDVQGEHTLLKLALAFF